MKNFLYVRKSSGAVAATVAMDRRMQPCKGKSPVLPLPKKQVQELQRSLRLSAHGDEQMDALLRLIALLLNQVLGLEIRRKKTALENV